jgi:hypothetical protein
MMQSSPREAKGNRRRKKNRGTGMTTLMVDKQKRGARNERIQLPKLIDVNCDTSSVVNEVKAVVWEESIVV